MVARGATQHGLGDPSMLERIDDLFACGAGEHVNIPQIVVVGDQSSGKSSVLSGMIRKDLPRDSSLCTRFATKIIFRRAEETSIRVSVIPDENAGPEHRAAIANAGPINFDSFDDVDFSDIMKEVYKIMDIRNPGEKSSSKPTFSGDVLQLEISGPKEEHLSVIDVPGIFRDKTDGETTEDDIKFVDALVRGYMKNPRSVMLAVIPANVDVAVQEILRLANQVDPDGDRTLGVLTKPDLVDKGAEQRVVDIIEGRARQIKLGWHVLRNPGQRDLGDVSFDRQKQEMDFFNNERPWNGLDKDSVGIEALRSRLKDVLSRLVRKEFANVRVEVQKKLDAAEVKLKSLGPERNSRAAQSAYLTEMATNFQHLVDLTLRANFGTEDLFEKYEELKVAPAVILRMEGFAKDMTHFGHTYSFNAPRVHQEEAFEVYARIGPPSHERATDPIASEILVRRRTERIDFAHLLGKQTKLTRPDSESTDDWLRELHDRSRGFELGTFDPVIVASAMREQTKNWQAISSGFVSDIAVITHLFITKALDCLCSDDRLKDELYHMLYEELEARYKKAIEQVAFILAVELKGTPMTQNKYFLDRLEESHRNRLIAPFNDLAIHDRNHELVVRISDLTTKQPTTNGEYLVRHIHDTLQSYYESARPRFVDTVIKQAVDYYLVTGPETPLRVFSPKFVGKMTDEQLEQVAREEPQIQKQRAKLINDIASLRKARKVMS